jgi:hypothetical protein
MLYIEKSGSPGSEASNYENETRFYGFFFRAAEFPQIQFYKTVTISERNKVGAVVRKQGDQIGRFFAYIFWPIFYFGRFALFYYYFT